MRLKGSIPQRIDNNVSVFRNSFQREEDGNRSFFQCYNYEFLSFSNISQQIFRTLSTSSVLHDMKYCKQAISEFPRPLFQNEDRCSAFDMEIIFHSHENKIHFPKKGCAPSLILKVRVFGTGNWPIDFVILRLRVVLGGFCVELHYRTVHGTLSLLRLHRKMGQNY